MDPFARRAGKVHPQSTVTKLYPFARRPRSASACAFDLTMASLGEQE
jgi:hypothetical protein